MCASESVDYSIVLEDLRARRDKLSIAIAAIEEVALSRAPTPGSEEPGRVTARRVAASEAAVPVEVHSDTFFGMSATDAARKYLRMKKRPRPLKEICEALLHGGYLTNAKNFYSNLYTTFARTDDFVKVKKEWGLAEWYPGRNLEQQNRSANSLQTAEQVPESLAVKEGSQTGGPNGSGD